MYTTSPSAARAARCAPAAVSLQASRADPEVVLHRECSSSCEIVVAHARLDRADVMRELCGEGEGLAHQTRDTLP